MVIGVRSTVQLINVLCCVFACLASVYANQFGLLWTQPNLFTSPAIGVVAKPIRLDDLKDLVQCWSTNSCTSFGGVPLKKIDEKPDVFIFVQTDVSATEFSFHANGFSEAKDGGVFKFIKKSISGTTSISWVSAEQNTDFIQQLADTWTSNNDAQLYANTNTTFSNHKSHNFMRYDSKDNIKVKSDKKLHMVFLPNQNAKNSDTKETLTSADSIIQTVLSDPKKRPFIASLISFQTKSSVKSSATINQTAFSDYFTPEAVVVLIFAFVLLLILYTGLSCLLSLQTPTRFHATREQLDAKNK